jgi:hypothetical protein
MHIVNRTCRTGIVALALAAALIPLPPTTVERWYSATAYAALQPRLTSLSNLVPFSLFDAFIAAVATVWMVLAAGDMLHTPSRVRGALRIVARTIVGGAALYLLFLALWGLNYRRPRLRDTLPYDASAVTPDAVVAAGRLAVDRLNGLHDRAHAIGWPAAGEVDVNLADGFARAVRDAGVRHDVVPARPKATILEWYFRRAGVDGMTDPFFLETLVTRRLLPFERPFVVAHEWSHLAGIADEGEANFTAWQSCAGGAAPNAYSGWLFLYSELARATTAPDRAALASGLGPGPRADLRAIRDRYLLDVSRRVSDAGWRVYDSYLKANRVESGTQSYDEVVRLVLGLRLNGRPVLESR